MNVILQTTRVTEADLGGGGGGRGGRTPPLSEFETLVMGIFVPAHAPQSPGLLQFRPQQFCHQNNLGISFAPSNFAPILK